MKVPILLTIGALVWIWLVIQLECKFLVPYSRVIWVMHKDDIVIYVARLLPVLLFAMHKFGGQRKRFGKKMAHIQEDMEFYERER